MSLAKYFEPTILSTLKFSKLILKGKVREDTNMLKEFNIPVQMRGRITAELQDRAGLWLTLFRIF